jgi:flagellar biosynthetic protein FliO
MLCALAIVVVAVYGGLWLLKRLMSSRQRHNGGQSILEVIETTCVGPKKNISLVRVADRTVLIGITDAQISVLTEFDADDTAVVLAKEEVAEPEEGFGNLLGTAASKMRSLMHRRMPVAQES